MEGGCIVTDDEEIYHILLCIRAHGWTRNLPKFNKVTGEKSDDPFEEAFKFVLPGYNVRPLEMSGALGIEQLKKLPDFIKTRQKNAKLFQSLFSDHRFIDIQQETG
jgi:dTDP-4-amino-4,6-dideoxygalactose transaminase